MPILRRALVHPDGRLRLEGPQPHAFAVDVGIEAEARVIQLEPSGLTARRWLRSFLFYYPLTLAGSLLLAAALYLLGRSLAQENSYGVLLALAALLVLSALSVTARLQANTYRRRLVQWHWDSTAPLYARRAGLAHALITDPLRTLPFFRIHFAIKGTLKVGGKTAKLSDITIPVFAAMAEHDHIVSYKASKPLLELVGSEDKEEIVLKGGHVSLIAGPNAARRMWPKLAEWMGERSV